MRPFEISRARGREGEAEIARYYSARFTVDPASWEDDLRGIDMWFIDGERRIAVQVKTEDAPARTGNLFIETVSNDVLRTRGWAVDPVADLVLYYVPPSATVYEIPASFIRANLPRWAATYTVRATAPWRNAGYRTRGVCVPIREFAQYGVRLA